MGSGFSRFSPCCCQQPPSATTEDLIFAAAEEPLDETLGHSFCYVRSSARFVSPCHSDRFSPNSHSPSHPQSQIQTATNTSTITGFKSISGASVSANTSTPRTVVPHDHIYDEAITSAPPASDSTVISGGFQSTSNFSALPLQPVPHGDGERGFFMSGPIERGALSGPLDPTTVNFDHAGHGQVPFSAPLNGLYVRRKRKKGLSGITKAFHSEKKKPWVVPVLNFVGRRDGSGQNVTHEGAGDLEVKNTTIDNNNVQWAHGKAGEDRVHVVVSEEHGWLFVGIYDGFNGPDAPEFLMGNLYRAVFNELQGLFWEVVENVESNVDGFGSIGNAAAGNDELVVEGGGGGELELEMQLDPPKLRSGSVKRVTFQSEKIESTTKRLWEFLAEEQADDGLDLSGSERFAFSVDDAVRVSNAGSTVKKRSLLLSKLKYGFSKHKEGQGHSRRFFPWRYDWEDKDKPQEENTVGERTCQSLTKRSVGPVDHELVLRALSQALDVTELAYLDMTDKVLDRNPELALMGSCLLVVLMRDEDVYVMNVGDSRAIVAQYQPHPIGSSAKVIGHGSRLDSEDIVEESIDIGDRVNRARTEASAEEMKLTALQLSTDHSTSIEEEVLRIKEEHPDDNHCIVNDRVKGRLKVTRAFGAGFLKQPKLNDALLEMFRNEYIGTAPYISCSPSLRHHKLGPNDQFLILSSDGLYQYLSNEEVVSNVESFMEKFPDGDPAQHLIEELLFRAAKKAGMEFHELLDIPQGDRRKYHDDVTVMVISLEGRIWKSSGKYL